MSAFSSPQWDVDKKADRLNSAFVTGQGVQDKKKKRGPENKVAGDDIMQNGESPEMATPTPMLNRSKRRRLKRKQLLAAAKAAREAGKPMEEQKQISKNSQGSKTLAKEEGEREPVSGVSSGKKKKTSTMAEMKIDDDASEVDKQQKNCVSLTPAKTQDEAGNVKVKMSKAMRKKLQKQRKKLRASMSNKVDDDTAAQAPYSLLGVKPAQSENTSDHGRMEMQTQQPSGDVGESPESKASKKKRRKRKRTQMAPVPVPESETSEPAIKMRKELPDTETNNTNGGQKNLVAAGSMKGKQKHKNMAKKKQQGKWSITAETATNEASAEASTNEASDQKPEMQAGKKRRKHLLPLREKMMHQLESSRFRYINEQLYSNPSCQSQQLFSEDLEAFKAYHRGYQQQVAQWPMNPLNKIITAIKKTPVEHVVADFGCGEAQLANSVPHKVHSFDFVALSDAVTVCDMAHTPLPAASVDIAVFCLSLMGTNLCDFVLEANRVLKDKGTLMIADVASRFHNFDSFVHNLTRLGFYCTAKDTSHDLFYFVTFKKDRTVKKGQKLPILSLRPCLYKKR